MSTLHTEEAEAAVRLVVSGDMPVTMIGSWPYCGWPEFESPSGWRFCVFSDCDEFDYFEWIVAPDGRRWTYRDASLNDCARMGVLTEEIDNHHRSAWGVPE